MDLIEQLRRLGAGVHGYRWERRQDDPGREYHRLPDITLPRNVVFKDCYVVRDTDPEDA